MKHKLSYIAAVWWVILCVIAGIFVLILSDKDGKVSAGEIDAGIDAAPVEGDGLFRGDQGAADIDDAAVGGGHPLAGGGRQGRGGEKQ